MKNIKVPDWWDSIRAIIALVLVGSFCAGVFVKEVPAQKLSLLKELALLAITFYFVLKKRKEEEEK